MKKFYSLDDLAVVTEICNSYNHENISEHLVEIELRAQKLNQTCVSAQSKIRYTRIESNFNSIKNTYINTTDYKEETKFAIIQKITQLNKDMLELEKDLKKGAHENE